MSSHPDGMVTFLFTDVESSTSLIAEETLEQVERDLTNEDFEEAIDPGSKRGWGEVAKSLVDED